MSVPFVVSTYSNRLLGAFETEREAVERAEGWLVRHRRDTVSIAKEVKLLGREA